ncbi:hypothetical protein Hanom_Chr14g01266081 [Helianthus anomalus]
MFRRSRVRSSRRFRSAFSFESRDSGLFGTRAAAVRLVHSGSGRLSSFLFQLARVHVKTHQIWIRFSFGSCSVGPASVSSQTWLTFGQAGSTSQTRGWVRS